MSPPGLKTITTEAVICCLERAGATELLLREPRCRPREFHTAWPEYQAEWLAYAAEAAEAPKPTLKAADVSHYDAVRRWISAGVPSPAQRRVLGLRMLVFWAGHEREGENLHSWVACARRLHCDAQGAEQLFAAAVERLTAWLNRQATAGDYRLREQLAWAFRERGAGLSQAVTRLSAAAEAREVRQDSIRAAWFG
jgi:hypothetical protein